MCAVYILTPSSVEIWNSSTIYQQTTLCELITDVAITIDIIPYGIISML